MENNIKDVNKIIGKYTSGEATLEETNAALEAMGSNLRIVIGKNELTAVEIDETVVGETAAEADGWGLLDMGLGAPSKVEVRAGKLIHENVGAMYALCIIGGKMYHVEGDALLD